MFKAVSVSMSKVQHKANIDKRQSPISSTIFSLFLHTSVHCHIVKWWVYFCTQKTAMRSHYTPIVVCPIFWITKKDMSIILKTNIYQEQATQGATRSYRRWYPHCLCPDIRQRVVLFRNAFYSYEHIEILLLKKAIHHVII